MEISVLQLRCFREEDTRALASLMARLGGDSLLPVPLEERLGRPGYCPQEDLFLAEREGRIVAWLDTFRELGLGRVVVEAGVLPGLRKRQVVSLLLQQAMENASNIGARAVHCPAPGSDRATRRCLESHGFSPIRQSLRLSRRRRQVAAVPGWPPVRPMAPGEEGTLTRIQNLSFGGSWGFQANTEQEVCYRLGLSCCSPEGVFFALLEGQVVGYCWTRELRGKGEIWMLGVAPAWQGRGVGRTLLLRGIHHLHQRGFPRVNLTVDAENATAITLYQSVGFRQTGTVVWYERQL